MMQVFLNPHVVFWSKMTILKLQSLIENLFFHVRVKGIHDIFHPTKVFFNLVTFVVSLVKNERAFKMNVQGCNT